VALTPREHRLLDVLIEEHRNRLFISRKNHFIFDLAVLFIEQKITTLWSLICAEFEIGKFWHEERRLLAAMPKRYCYKLKWCPDKEVADIAAR